VTWRDVVREALSHAASHRLRAALASLGVLTGVAAVMTASAISTGAKRQAMADVAALGIDNVIVRAADRDPGVAPLLGVDDAAALVRTVPGAAVSVLRRSDDVVHHPRGDIAIAVAGVTASWRETAGLQIEDGRWIRDREPGAPAVIDRALARRLFGEAEPLGRRLLAAGEWRTVAGVLASAPPSANAPVQALNLHRTVFVPLDAMDVSLGAGDDGTAVEQIVVRLPPGSDHERASAAIDRMLRDRHAPSAYDVVVPRELLRARLRAQRTFDAILYSVGGLALVVSALGIATIMVASVSERAAEIGVRRAVGARRSTIVRQFAAEAVVLAAAGGAAGVCLGTAAAFAVGTLAGWPVVVTPGAVAVALLLAAGVGLAAGTYPARLAASITPIDALRQ
jgi:putative ABC transport system permease protein